LGLHGRPYAILKMRSAISKTSSSKNNVKKCGDVALTSATAGTENVGTPFATLPNPASDPHMVSENASSSVINARAFRTSLAALVVENRSTKVFMVTELNVNGLTRRAAFMFVWQQPLQ
jgi:hypothetical protein